MLLVGVHCVMPWSPLGGCKQGKGLQSDMQLQLDSHTMQKLILAQALTGRSGRWDSVTAQARSFCCLPQPSRSTATKRQAESLQARPAQELQKRRLGRAPCPAGRRRGAACSPALLPAAHLPAVAINRAASRSEILHWCL